MARLLLGLLFVMMMDDLFMISVKRVDDGVVDDATAVAAGCMPPRTEKKKKRTPTNN